LDLASALLARIASVTELNVAKVPSASQPDISQDVDVRVVAGGTAGTTAAIQAGAPARASCWWSETASSAAR